MMRALKDRNVEDGSSPCGLVMAHGPMRTESIDVEWNVRCPNGRRSGEVVA